jgi:hypothetical protein
MENAMTSEQQSIEEPTKPATKKKQKPAQHPLLRSPDQQSIEVQEWNQTEANEGGEGLQFLYPTLNNPNFALDIAERKEFNDTKYNIVIPESQRQMESEAAKLCSAEFELAPHQLFVRNFLSMMTPYNSLLLYHGLGTGKTCSAISVAEEMRDYMTQLGLTKKILVVASVNVQDNFRKQLFDVAKLEFDRNKRQFVIRGCTGKKLLKEVGANAELTDLTERNIETVRAGIVQRITRVINASYEFMGYIELANLVRRLTTKPGMTKPDAIRAITREFNDRLLIVDEIHNVRSDEEAKEAKEAKESGTGGTSVSEELYKLVRYAVNLRLLLLSGTPMYNDPREIVWLLNLMNTNDRRSTIAVNDVFDRHGNLLEINGRAVGAELLRMKSNGHISVVKGENPYIFPFRMYPREFAAQHSFLLMDREERPALQLNGTPIPDPMQHLDVYLNTAGSYQEAVYSYIIERKKLEMSKEATSFGSFLLKQPIEALNMVYPSVDFDRLMERRPTTAAAAAAAAAAASVSVADTALLKTMDVKGLLGDAGLRRVMKYEESEDGVRIFNYDYKEKTMKSYGRIFSRAEIGKYSSKIASICDHIEKANGVVLIYSEYIGGGAVPIALALEEMGFTRYDKEMGSLFKTAPVAQRVIQRQQRRFAAKYAMFTGDKQLSPDNRAELEALTTDNANGQRIKVVIISKAGSEGIDFKNVRQVHIMEPWYNMNRIEQIIGRAVRNCSHADLPFTERNVQLFLYGTLLAATPDVEAADLYVYRLAEAKAVQIGRVSRLLKENAVDCLLNIDQTNFSQDVIRRHNGGRNVAVRQVLADGTVIANYVVGDRPFSFVCDYQGTCEYTCISGDGSSLKVNEDTYSEPFIVMNADRIIQRIRDLFKERHFYKRSALLKHLIGLGHSEQQVDVALTRMLADDGHLVDQYGRAGRLINVGKYYLFQPLEITDPRISVHARSAPLQFKRDHISFPLADGTLDMLAEKHGFSKPKQIAEAAAVPAPVQEMKSAYQEIIGALSAAPQQKKAIDKNTKTWNELCPDVMRELHETQGIDMTTLKRCVVEHFVEDLLVSSYDTGLQYLNMLYSPNANDEFDRFAREYFDNQIRTNPKYAGEQGILMLKKQTDNGWQGVVRKNAESAWAEPASKEEWRHYTEDIAAKMPRESNLSPIIGFVAEFKEKSGGSYAVFKIKYVQEKGTGARCDQISSKQRRLTIVNQVMHGLDSDSPPTYTMENTKDQNTARFCVLPELLLRSHNLMRKDGKHWFLTPVQVVYLEKKASLVRK